MYTFLIFDKKTGEYIGKRETSRRYPEWQEGVDVVKGEALSFQERTRVMSNPEHFKRIKGRLIELGKKEKDAKKLERKVKVIRRLDIK